MNRALVTPFLMAALYFALSAAFHFAGGAIDQPHPIYAEGNWITHRMPELLHWSEAIGIVMFILVSADIAVQHVVHKGKMKDLAYFPRFQRICEFLKPDGSRWILICGAAFLALYWGQSVIEVWRWEQINSGWVWPPERFFVTCLLIWGLVWIADCLSRPRSTTIVAAVGFSVFTLIFVLPVLGTGILRE
jgi:hypothetical protein